MATPFHTRADWGARPPRSVTRRDLWEDTAHYGGPSPWGSGPDRSSPARFAATTDHNRCATIVRAYQAFHMDSRGWQDIAYSSLVCPHGHRYEGRGHDVRTAANGTTAGNDASHATCYIAGDNDPLTDPAKAAFADESRRLDGLTKGHRDWKSTACPGDALYRWVHGGQPVPTTPTVEDDDMPLNAADKVVIRDIVQGVLDANARRVYGVTSFERLLEIVVDSVRVAARQTSPSAEQIASAVIQALPNAGDLDAELVEAAVRRVFADAGA